MSGELEPYIELVKQAYSGKLKLPAFQRDWKWQKSQVVLLFDSIRQRFPIGSFLLLTQGPNVNLSPRSFRGSAPSAENNNPARLVLDGQQRLTAGLELFFGQGKNQYFLDINKLYSKFLQGKYDIDSSTSIESFLYDLEAEDGYIIGMRKQNDPDALLIKRGLLWTKRLMDDADFSRRIDALIEERPELKPFCNYVVGPNFKPNSSLIIPVSKIGEDATVEAICRIFATLNSTGKILTPFEIVAAVLYPEKITLQEDVETARALYSYYNYIDANGDLLLQTIALFDGKDTKKASLPKTINKHNYTTHRDEAIKYLHEAGRLMTSMAGLGLDRSNELLVYPVIFPPMAYVLKWMDGQQLDHAKKAEAHRKLVRWFYASILSRRYQQSTHDKQLRDRSEIPAWISGYLDKDIPTWIADEVSIPKNLPRSAPNSALGKLVLCLLNHKSPRDALSDDQVGLSVGAVPNGRHHIFPTKFVTNLRGWLPEDKNDSVLNIMYVSEKTNISWSNIDPALQVSQAMQAQNSLERSFGAQFISNSAIEILKKQQKSRDDFYNFISEREKLVRSALEEYGFKSVAVEVNDEGDDDDE